MCDAAWSGAADMYDQVVAHLDNGAPLSLDCLVPTDGVRAIVRAAAGCMRSTGNGASATNSAGARSGH